MLYYNVKEEALAKKILEQTTGKSFSSVNHETRGNLILLARVLLENKINIEDFR